MSSKTIIRNNIARLLYGIGVTRPNRCGNSLLSIATFHRVLPEFERRAYPFPGLAVTPDELDTFLSYFSKHYDCGDLATQHERYLKKEKITRPLLAITFDDAQYDNYKYARPVLKKHNIKASFFVPVVAVEQQELLWHDRLGFAMLAIIKQGHIGQDKLMRILKDFELSASGNIVSQVAEASKSLNLKARLRLIETLVSTSGLVSTPEFARLMTFDEISELSFDGHEIGSHSMTHCLMPECDDISLAYEIVESRKILVSRLKMPIETFCYPNGNSDFRTAQAVAQAGYRRAVTTTWGGNGKEADQFQLRRFDMVAKHVQDSNQNFLPALLAFRMSGLYPGLRS